MGKNNFDERLRKMEPRKDHYSIRKFSVGVASVLIGFSFLGLANNQTVKADKVEPQVVKASDSENSVRKQDAQDAQNKTDESNVSADNSEVKQMLTGVQAAAEKNRSLAASARKDSKLINVSESGTKLNDIGLSGRKDTQGTDTKSQNVNGQSEKNSAPVDKNTDAAKKTAVKSDSKSNQVVDEKSTGSKDNQFDTQKLTIKTSDIKLGKTAQADELAKELSANLTTDKSGKTSKLTLKRNGTDDKSSSGAEQTLNINKTAGLDTKKKALLVGQEKFTEPTGTVDVSNWKGLAEAINNSSIGTINFKNSITVGGDVSGEVKQANSIANPAKLQFEGKGIARQLTINGNGYTLDFGGGKHYSYYWSFTDNNQNDKKNNAWNLIFKNITINAKGCDTGYDVTFGAYQGGFAPIYMGDDLNSTNAEADTVTFDGVTANVTNGPVVSGSMHVSTGDNSEETVVFRNSVVLPDGKKLPNKIYNENVNVDSNSNSNYGSTISAGRVIVESGTTTINTGTAKTNNADNYGGNAIYTGLGDVKDSKGNITQASVWIKQGATLNINGGYTDKNGVSHSGVDVRGIVVNDYNSNDGTLQVDGTYNANMSTGHSTAIQAANLNISSTGTVKINTKQDNEADTSDINRNSITDQAGTYTGTHYAPISLGQNHEGKLDPAANQKNNLIDDGSLTIIRNNNGETMTPLISFGIGTGSQGGALNYSTYNMTVGNDAVLNLQDNSSTISGALGNVNPKYSNSQKQGLITMWGDAAHATLNLNNPQYVNFQRTGSSRGTFLLIQSSHSSINVSGTNLTVAQWKENSRGTNPDYRWNINGLKAFNNWGDNANTGFSPTTSGTPGNGPTIAHQGIDYFGESDGTVKLISSNGKTYTYENGVLTPDESNQPADFSSFLKSFSFWTPQRLSFGEKYTARYQGTTIKQGSEQTVSPSIVNQNTGKTILSTVTETYQRSEDTPNWVTVKNDGSLVLKPTTSTAVGMYNIPISVIYNDNPSQTVYAPVYIIKDNNHQVIWGKDSNGKATGAIVVVTDPRAHETSGSDQVLNADDVVSEIDQYKAEANGKETANGTIDKSNARIAWQGSAPSTHVDTPSITGKNLSGNIDIDLSNVSGIDSILGNSSKSVSQAITFTAAGAETGNPSVDVVRGQQPTSDQLKQLVNHSKLDSLPDGMAVEKYELKPHTTLDTSTKGKKDVTIRILFKDKDAQGHQTYLDLPAITGGINVVNNDADTYGAHYQGATVKQGGRGAVAKPSITKKDDGSKAPSTVTETYKRTADTPSWVTVNNTDGSLTLTPTTDNSAPGMYNVPVLVTYNDNSSETVYAPVYVTNDDNHHVIWGKDGRSAVIVVTQPVTLHQTSDNSMVTTNYANQAIKGFDIYTKDSSNSDKINTTVDAYTYKNGQYQDAAGHNLGSITVAWNGDPSTVVTTPRLSSSQTPEIKITFNAGSAPISDGIFDAGKSDTVKAPLSLFGATRNTKNPYINVIRGQQPTSDQLAQLVDHSKLDKLLDDGIKVDHYELVGTLDTSTTGKKDVTIRIVFKDKDAQTNSTHLDLPAITDGINVINNDADTYTAHYQGTTVKQGETGTVAIPSISKKSNGTVDPNTVTETYKRATGTQGWVTVNNDGSLTLKPTTSTTVGMYNVPVLVTYNDNSTETVYAPVYVTKDDVHHVTWGKDGHSAVVTVTQPITLHQTSGSSMVTTNYAGQSVKEFDVYTKDAANPDKISTTAKVYSYQNGEYQDAAGNKLGSVTIVWNSDLSTVVTSPSLTSSQTPEIKITFNAGSAPVSDGIFDAGKSDTLNAQSNLDGAQDKTGISPIDVVRGQQPTSDQLAKLVDHSKLDDLPSGIKVAHYELVGRLDTSTTGKKNVTIRIVFQDKNAGGKATYLDLPAITNGINVIASQADKFKPSYSSTTLRPGQTISVNPSWQNNNAPTGETFAIETGTDTPTWATIDPSTGKINFAPSADAQASGYHVPVKVTYQDGSSATVYAPVYVTDGQHTVTWGGDMSTMYEGPVATYHKTTSGNDVDIKNSRLDKIYHWDDQNNETIWTLTHTSDDDYYVETTGAHLGSRFAAGDITYNWITDLKGVSAPSTDVTAFNGDTGSLLYLNSDGTVNKDEQTGPDEDLPGNSKWRYHFTIGGDAPTDIDVPAGMWANIYFNFLGATGKTDIPVNVGDAVPTDANGIEQYLDKNDVGIPSAVSAQSYGAINKDWTVTNISWETGGKPGSDGKFDGSHKDGVIRFDFKDSSNKTSFLDVKVSFKTGSYVSHNNNNGGKNDDTNLYVTRTIHYDVPAGQTDVRGVVQSVHYIRDGYHKVNSQGNDLPDIVWNSWKLADGQTAKFPEIETVKQFTGYDSYVNYDDDKGAQKSENVASANVSVDNGKPQDGKEVTITYVKQNATPIKYNPNSTDDNITVHRHITYDVSGTGHAAIDPVDQTVDYIREDADGNAGYTDPVTGKTTYVAWTVKNGGSASFPEQDVTQITGYDSYVGSTKATTLASADVVEDKDGKPQNADDVTITYKASHQSIKFEFWDDTDNKEIDSDHTLNGKTNQTVDTNLTAPLNYDLAKGTDNETNLYSIPANYKFAATNPAVIKIHFVHGTEIITHDKPSTTIKGAEASDLTTKVTRKVTITTPATDGQTAKSDIKNQEVDFGRSVKVDKVTDKIISYSDWEVISSNSTLAEVDAPTVAGYTPTINKADEITPKAGDKVDDVTINYNANDQSSYYKFIDDDDQNKQVGDDHIIEGKTDQTIDLNISAPENYILTPGQTIPTKYTFKAGVNDPLTIHLKHKVDTIDPNKPTNPDKIPAGAKNSDGSDVTEKNFSEKVKRTITAKEPQADGTTKDVDLSQTVTIHRTGKYDEVTKTMTYNDWVPGTFKAVDAPTVAGYSPSQGSIAAEAATDGFNKTYTITYTANGQKMVYTYWDDTDNKKIASTETDGNYTISGKTGDTVSTGLAMPEGYDLAAGNSLPTSYTFTSDKVQTATIHFVHHIDKNVTKTPTGGAKNPDGSDVKDTDFSKTVKETITAEEPTGDVDLSQTTNVTRSGDFDEVTKKISWHPWTTGSFSAVSVPIVDGYTPSQDVVQAVTSVGPDYQDPDIKITYTLTSITQQISYQFVDDENKGVNVGNAISISGVAGHLVNPSTKISVPAGYELAKGTDSLTDLYHIPTSVMLSSDNKELGKTVKIHLVHGTKKVEPGEISTPSGTIPGDNGNKTPGDGKPKNDITYNNLHKDITRTITVNTPNATPTVITQTVTYQRSATIDDVTGNVKYGDWAVAPASKEQSLAEYDVPSVSGFTPSQSRVDAETPTSAQVDNWSDPKIVITYTKLSSDNPGGDDHQNPPTQGQIIIKYVDPSGKTVHTVTVPVDKGSTIDPSGAIKSNVPKGYKLPDGYTAPTSASEGSTISVSVVPTNQKKPTPTPTPTPGRGGHKPTHNNGGKSSHKGNSRKTNAPKHNAKTGSNSAPLSERGRRGLSGHDIAALEAEKGIGQNGVKTVKMSGQNGSHNANTLPQTGENDNRTKIMSTIGFLGLTAAGIVALLALGGDRKRK